MKHIKSYHPPIKNELDTGIIHPGYKQSKVNPHSINNTHIYRHQGRSIILPPPNNTHGTPSPPSAC
ncbi:hypothetical protein BDQ94DRAFT_53200 [Aspergillus welwitschiae]|uniref:Uncharacterized protein n=1 Tax=Aspergillus welwitschiae TaxID=1341132 RepID=A0A3F3PYF8_9EURO|nr:hypothetical protein BDQ94DRAFT_53200 [Aspergillus welwitschiae]RDH31921.1 hypothetical protein BDQ94DRAFT_53200 [Aspergillus welwitschiae]